MDEWMNGWMDVIQLERQHYCMGWMDGDVYSKGRGVGLVGLRLGNTTRLLLFFSQHNSSGKKVERALQLVQHNTGCGFQLTSTLFIYRSKRCIGSQHSIAIKSYL